MNSDTNTLIFPVRKKEHVIIYFPKKLSFDDLEYIKKMIGVTMNHLYFNADDLEVAQTISIRKCPKYRKKRGNRQ